MHQYALREGLPQSEVRCLLEDSRGALWVGTAGGGVARFDGMTFSVLNTGNGLPGNEVRAMAQDAAGRVWIGTDRGLVVYDGLSLLAPTGGAAQASVHALFCNQNQRMLVGAEDSLYTLTTSDRRPTVIGATKADDPLTHIIEWQGQRYGCGHRGLHQLTDSAGATSAVQLFSNGLMLAERLFVHPDLGLCMVTNGEGVWAYDASGGGMHRVEPGLPKNLYDALTLPSGEVAYASRDHGVLFVSAREGAQRTFGYEHGLPRNNVRRLLLDRWGNLWVGTTGSGLVKLSRQPFEHYDVRLTARQTSEPVYAMAGPDSALFIAVGSNGIRKLVNGKPLFDEVSSRLNTKSKALFLDRLNRLWIGTENDGLYLRTDSTLEHMTGATGIGGSFTRGFCQDPSGAIWVATLGGGITRINERPGSKGWQTTIYSRSRGLADNRVNCIACDAAGRVWYGTGSGHIGVIIVQGKGEEHLNYRPESGIAVDPVNAIALDAQGNVWAGLTSGQVWKLDVRASGSEGLQRVVHSGEQPYVLYAIGFDAEDNLWLGGADGAYRWVLNESGEVIDALRFTDEDGFESGEVCSNAIYRSDQGSLWFGTLEGLSAYRSRSPERGQATLPPVVHLVRPHLAYRPMKTLPQRHFVRAWDTPADTLVLTYTQNNLSFEVEAIHLTYANNLTYSYLLQGSDSDWSPPSRRNFISLSNLRPGSYTLRSRTCVKGESCAETKPLTLIILEPYWMSSWFRNSVMLAAVALVVLLFSLLLWMVKRRAKRRNVRLRMERDLLELEQRALRLQMNPHFIFNTLNSIQGLIAREEPRAARQALSRFAKLMREILQNSREEQIGLSEEFETLRNYLELARFTHENVFEYDLHLEKGLEDVPIPPLLLQPFVENAIIHGLLPVGGGRVIVQAVSGAHSNEVRIVVEDNGVGMKPNETKEPKHRSAGLDVTLERLIIFAGESEAPIVKFETPDSGGTRVVIRLRYVEIG